jgi:hypothetical protein
MKSKEIIYSISRFFPAFMLMLYGVSKILGTQFGVSEWVADLPASQLTGFQLTWYYFNYSLYYGYVLASVQIAGALLLIIRRTTLLAVILLLPVMINIVFINLFYGITEGALFMSLLITGSLFITLFFHFRELKDFFWSKQLNEDELSPIFANRPKTKAFLKSAVIIVPIVILTLSKLQETPKSPFDGVWDVTEWVTENNIDEIPTRIYFETITNHHAMFRFQNFRRQYRVDYDAGNSSIRIILPRVDGPEEFFVGNYELTEDKLQLTGTLLETEDHIDMILTRVR